MLDPVLLTQECAYLLTADDSLCLLQMQQAAPPPAAQLQMGLGLGPAPLPARALTPHQQQQGMQQPLPEAALVSKLAQDYELPPALQVGAACRHVRLCRTQILVQGPAVYCRDAACHAASCFPGSSAGLKILNQALIASA